MVTKNLDGRITRLERAVNRPLTTLRVIDRRQLDGKPGLAIVYKDKITLVGGISYDDI